MAAPMNSPPARIALSFDSPILENCWLVVDLSKHLLIEDIENEIKKKFFKTSTEDSRIVLRLNNFRLPTSESSILLRDNDIVSVSLEKCCRSPNLVESDINTRKAKKRNYKDVYVTDKPRDGHQDHSTDQVDEPKKSKKKKKKLEQEGPTVSDNTNNSNETVKEAPNVCALDDAVSSKKMKKLLSNETSGSSMVAKETCKDQKEDSDNDSNVKEVCYDGENIRSVINAHTDLQGEPDDGTVDSGDDDQSIKKSTRKRHRKRKRKTRSHDVQSESVEKSEDKVVDTVIPYKGRDIDKDQMFYGSIPDKLESPRNYRHGYRNLQSYHVQSNMHKKFGSESDSDGETKENTEQYNFLCKKQEKLTGHSEFSAPTDSVVRSASSVAVEEDNNNTEESHKLSNFTACNGNQQLSSSQNHFQTPVRNNQAEVCDIENTKNLNNISVVNDTTSHVSAMKTGTPLTRKTLSNGVAVFVRHRSPRTEFREQTKEEQLNTSSTNISTVFKNPGPTEFKVPVSPAVKHTSMIPAPVETVTATHSDGCTWKNKELHTFPLLKTCPKQGDIIAYKVLEISMNLTPEVSSYKVAKVISVDQNEMLELKTLKHSETGLQNDKFHIHIETDGEVLTNVADSDLAVLHFSSLLETRSLS